MKCKQKTFHIRFHKVTWLRNDQIFLIIIFKNDLLFYGITQVFSFEPTLLPVAELNLRQCTIISPFSHPPLLVCVPRLEKLSAGVKVHFASVISSPLSIHWGTSIYIWPSILIHGSNIKPFLFPNHQVRSRLFYYISILLESTGPFSPSERIPIKESFLLKSMKVNIYLFPCHLHRHLLLSCMRPRSRNSAKFFLDLSTQGFLPGVILTTSFSFTMETRRKHILNTLVYLSHWGSWHSSLHLDFPSSRC